MYTCLIVSGSSQWADKLKAFLQPHMEAEFSHAGHGGAARRIASQRSFDFCFINTPLPDEFGFDLAIDVAKHYFVQVLLIVPSELCGEYCGRATPQGIFVIGKPLHGQLLDGTLHGMLAAHSQAASLQQKMQRLQKQLDDLRLIDRAKCLLIASLSMSEAQAHHHIEQEAMNARTSKTEIAKKIIRAYGI